MEKTTNQHNFEETRKEINAINTEIKELKDIKKKALDAGDSGSVGEINQELDQLRSRLAKFDTICESLAESIKQEGTFIFNI